MHPLYILAFLTFIIVVGLAGWNYVATRRRQKHGPGVKGIGGEHDPLR